MRRFTDIAATRFRGSGGFEWASLSYLLVVGSLLGVSINIAKMTIERGGSPLFLLFWATLGAGTALLVIARLLQNKLQLTQAMIVYGLVSGALFAVPNLLAFMAIEKVGAGFVALNFAFPILLTYALALVFVIEQFDRWRAIGVAAGLAGGVLLAIGKVMNDNPPLPWLLITFSVPVIIALGNIYRTVYWPQGLRPIVAAPLMLLGGALTTGMIALFDGQFAVLWQLQGAAVEMLTLVQTFGFTLLYLLYFVLQKRAGPVYLSQIGSVGAVAGVCVAVLILEEALPSALLPAGILILIGIVMVSLAKSASAPSS